MRIRNSAAASAVVLRSAHKLIALQNWVGRSSKFQIVVFQLSLLVSSFAALADPTVVVSVSPASAMVDQSLTLTASITGYAAGEKSEMMLMMLAFLIDQSQLLGCRVYQKAKERAGRWSHLWELVRGLIHNFEIDSWDTLLKALAFGGNATRPLDTS